MQRHTLRDGNWRHTGANDDAGADTPNADFGAISEASITTGALAGVTTVEVAVNPPPPGRMEDEMTTELAVILLLLVGVGVYLLVEWADDRGA